MLVEIAIEVENTYDIVVLCVTIMNGWLCYTCK